ncbi:MAG TPA: hypothetical protein VFN21_12710, partial [Acidimicrobiales bacterium]|nr:hypothetical protein [Acidimicrobiales bacterium]
MSVAEPRPPEWFRDERARLVDDRSLDGGALRLALCDLTDRWLSSVFDAACVACDADGSGVALV